MKNGIKNFRVATYIPFSFLFFSLMMSFLGFVAIAVVYAHKEIVCVCVDPIRTQTAPTTGAYIQRRNENIRRRGLLLRSDGCHYVVGRSVAEHRVPFIPSLFFLSLYGFFFLFSRASRATKRNILCVASTKQFFFFFEQCTRWKSCNKIGWWSATNKKTGIRIGRLDKSVRIFK
jgi:hypothetical protein